MQNYKVLNHIVLWNVFFAIICIPTAGKLIDVMGILLSISIYYFPFVYIYIVHGKFVLTDDRSMIDWGAFGAPRRVDCDDLYRQPQTALQHRRISLCVRPAVREEEVAMVR